MYSICHTICQTYWYNNTNTFFCTSFFQRWRPKMSWRYQSMTSLPNLVLVFRECPRQILLMDYSLEVRRAFYTSIPWSIPSILIPFAIFFQAIQELIVWLDCKPVPITLDVSRTLSLKMFLCKWNQKCCVAILCRMFVRQFKFHWNCKKAIKIQLFRPFGLIGLEFERKSSLVLSDIGRVYINVWTILNK